MCTGIFFKTEEGKVIFARTLEWAGSIIWKRFKKKTHKGTYGRFLGTKKWILADGVNKNGLAMGAFFYPCNEKEYNQQDIEGKINLNTDNFLNYLISECNTLQEVINKVQNINIKLSIIKQNGLELPLSLHWLVCDQNGFSIVLEVLKGKVEVYSNNTGSFTNSPDFPRQLRFLEKYNKLSKFTIPSFSGQTCYQGTGQGDPSHSHPLQKFAPYPPLPGDATSPSRFVRSSFYSKNIIPPNNTKEGLEAAIRLLHNFDIPLGTIVENNGSLEVTEYTVAYCINDYQMKYAPYGYISKDVTGKEWKQTKTPVIFGSIQTNKIIKDNKKKNNKKKNTKKDKKYFIDYIVQLIQN